MALAGTPCAAHRDEDDAQVHRLVGSTLRVGGEPSNARSRRAKAWAGRVDALALQLPTAAVVSARATARESLATWGVMLMVLWWYAMRLPLLLSLSLSLYLFPPALHCQNQNNHVNSKALRSDPTRRYET